MVSGQAQHESEQLADHAFCSSHHRKHDATLITNWHRTVTNRKMFSLKSGNNTPRSDYTNTSIENFCDCLQEFDSIAAAATKLRTKWKKMPLGKWFFCRRRCRRWLRLGLFTCFAISFRKFIIMISLINMQMNLFIHVKYRARARDYTF